MQENEWTAAAYHDIDWLSHGRALKRLDRSRTTRSTIKFVHSWLPRSQQQHEIDEEKDTHCQNCTEQHPETEDHILRCTNELVKQARDTAIKSLRTQLSHPRPRRTSPTASYTASLAGSRSRLPFPKLPSHAPRRPLTLAKIPNSTTLSSH
jgi:hypothetical protein